MHRHRGSPLFAARAHTYNFARAQKHQRPLATGTILSIRPLACSSSTLYTPKCKIPRVTFFILSAAGVINSNFDEWEMWPGAVLMITLAFYLHKREEQSARRESMRSHGLEKLQSRELSLSLARRRARQPARRPPRLRCTMALRCSGAARAHLSRPLTQHLPHTPLHCDFSHGMITIWIRTQQLSKSDDAAIKDFFKLSCPGGKIMFSILRFNGWTHF